MTAEIYNPNFTTASRPLREKIEESIPWRLLTESIGPIRSTTLWVLNRAYTNLTDRKIINLNVLFARTPDIIRDIYLDFVGLSKYFDQQPSSPESTADISQLNQVLADMDHRVITNPDSGKDECVGLVGNQGVPERFIDRGLVKDWEKIRQDLQAVIKDWEKPRQDVQASLGEGLTIINYVSFDRLREQYTIFVTDQNTVRAVSLPKGELTVQSFLAELSNTQIKVQLPDVNCKSPELRRRLQVELAVDQCNKLISSDGRGEPGAVREITTVTNDFPHRRHEVYGREGKIFTSLRHKGAWTIGELQEANRQLFEFGTRIDPKTCELVMDQDLTNIWINTAVLAGIGEQDTLKAMLQKFGREKVYYDLIYKKIKDHPTMVVEFINSGEYEKYAHVFKDTCLASLGATEINVATSMLANFYLLRFEGVAYHRKSNSQCFINDEGYYAKLTEFIEKPKSDRVSLPKVSVNEVEQSQISELKQIAESFGTKLIDLPCGKPFDFPNKAETVNEAIQALVKVHYQLKRHPFNQKVVAAMAKYIGLIPSNESILSTLIANMALARVPGESYQFTQMGWLPNADRFYAQGIPLPEIGKIEASSPTVNEAIKYIFNGTHAEDSGDDFNLQRERIMRETPRILEYLINDNRVPKNVKEFIQELTCGELGIIILELFGPAADQDPNIVNRFFPQGLAEFQKMSIYRFVHDFVRGVETNLILQTRPIGSKLKRQYTGRWENNDFSKVSEQELAAAINRTLSRGDHRIRYLNHEDDVRKESLKDWQEYFEVVFGWDTFDMKYLRWKSSWNVHNLLGGAWDCICFSRGPIFSIDVLQQM